MKAYQHDLMAAYARAVAKPKEESVNRFIDAVRRERPDLDGQTAYVDEQGDTAHVVFIGNEVFKGPKGKDDPAREAADIRRECSVTRYLAEQGLPVPSVTCEGQEVVFFGMERLPGVPLIGQMEDREFDFSAVAKEAACFAVQITRILSLEKINELGIERRHTEADILREILKNSSVRQGLGDSVAGCERLVEKYDEVFSKKKPVALHMDMNAGNILIDPVTKKVTGILDFGLITQGIPEALDDYKLWIYSNDFREAFCAECTAQGMLIDQRYRFLGNFAARLQAFYKSVCEGDIPSYGSNLFGSFRAQLDELTGSVPASRTTTSHPPRQA